MKRILAFAALFLFAVTAAQASSVNLTWSEPSTTVPYGFNVYRVTLPSGTTACPTFSTTSWTKVVGSLNSAQTTYSDTSITLNAGYCYAVTAYGTNGSGETGPSNLLYISTASSGGSSTTLPAPTSLSGTFVQ